MYSGQLARLADVPIDAVRKDLFALLVGKTVTEQ